MSIQLVATAALVLLLLAATINDLRNHRIPNLLSLGGVAVAILFQTLDSGASGLLFAFGGMAAAFLAFVLPYALSVMGAGDVKLMMAVGAFLGWTHTLEAVVATLLIGAVIGVGVLVARGGFRSMASRYGSMLLLAAAKRPTYLSPADGEAAGTRFPYALAIALGTLVELWRTGAL